MAQETHLCCCQKLCDLCLNTCLLSDWLQAISLYCAGPEKALESPHGKAAVDQVTPQTYQHSVNQSGTGLTTQPWMFCWNMNGSNLGSQMLKGYRQSWIYMFMDMNVCLFMALSG